MRKLIILLLICTTTAHAQEIEWQNTIGGSGVEFLNYTQQTSDGGYILGGRSNSGVSGDKTEPSKGDYDYWVVKLDATGNIQWQNTIGGDDADWLQSVQQTTDNGYILGGWSKSNISADKTENSQGASDFWVVKLDSIGNIQWQNTIGGDSTDNLYSLQQTTDGGYILGGFSISSISGDKTEYSIGGSDYWVVKLDASGNIQWQNTIGGYENDNLYSLQQTTDGGYILGGRSMSNATGDKTENSQGLDDYWVVKIDATGNIQWQNTIGGNSWDELESIEQTSDGGYILGGSSDSDNSGDKTENSQGDFDYWVVKLDATGNLQWQNTIGGDNWDKLKSIQQTTDGSYIFGGYSSSNISGDKTENSQGNYDYWVINIDSIGNILWQNTIGGLYAEALSSIKQTIDGGYIIGGQSVSPISGDKTEDSQGNNDYWVIKLTDKYNLIDGKMYADVNNNTIQDVGELGVSNKMVTEQNTGRLSFSQQNGKYSLSVLDTGGFSVSASTINYYNSVPLVHTAYFNNINQTDSLNDFALQPNGVINDVCINLTPVSLFRSGFDATYYISYINNGTTTLTPTTILPD